VSRLLVLPVAIPLLAAALTLLMRSKLAIQRALSVAASAAVLAFAIALVARTAGGEALAARIGGFPGPFAISFAADTFSALMLTVAALMVLVCTAFAIASRDRERPLLHPLILVLEAGVSGSFLTADLFNLFVFFEVMLISSYVLLTLGGSKSQVRSGTIYVATNLLGSTILLAGVGLTYAIAGTVNMASLASLEDPLRRLAVPGAMLLIAFAVKAALVPVHGWLPSAYPSARPAVAALFSGLLTKVGVYALYRVYSVVFDGDPAIRTLLLVIAATTMIVGVLGAIGRERVTEILSFHIVSQIGYMIMGLALFDSMGLAGGIFYILHHIVVKTSLFLSAGALRFFDDTDSLRDLGGVARERPVQSAAFMVAALSLAGLPPLSGFFAKLILLRAAFATGEYWIAGVAIAVSFLTLASMVKIWNGVYWGERPGDAPERPLRRSRVAAVAAPAATLALISITIGVAAEGMFTLSETAGGGLIDPTPYVEAVIGP